MRHIIDKVVLNLCIAFLSEDDEDREDKREQQHNGKNHRRNHEPDT